jgi:hypothetical protein
MYALLRAGVRGSPCGRLAHRAIGLRPPRLAGTLRRVPGDSPIALTPCGRRTPWAWAISSASSTSSCSSAGAATCRRRSRQPASHRSSARRGGSKVQSP